MKHRADLVFVILLAVFLNATGCFPSSCQRRVSRSLLPADSLSRALATETTLDTLRVLHRTSGSETHPLSFPRTVSFSPAATSKLYVSDVERNSIFVFEKDGSFLEEFSQSSFELPYIAGWRGDTLVVFNPPTLQAIFLVDHVPVRSLPAPPDLFGNRPLIYATIAENAFYIKAVGRRASGHLLGLDDRGRTIERHALTQPYWRHAGFLRIWGDSLLSLSGFRPVIDIFQGGVLRDTLSLVGFDSPMLARSRAFMMGEVHQAPLLSSSAVPAGDLLFVVNIRTGWLRLDVFDRQGQLLHRLIDPAPAPSLNFFPQDIAVRRCDDGTFDIAVILNEPVPRLDLYEWNPNPEGHK